jgi:hypothetical protein
MSPFLSSHGSIVTSQLLRKQWVASFSSRARQKRTDEKENTTSLHPNWSPFPSHASSPSLLLVPCFFTKGANWPPLALSTTFGDPVMAQRSGQKVVKMIYAPKHSLIFPRFGRVLKAEIYFIKIKKGIRNGKDPKSLHARI